MDHPAFNVPRMAGMTPFECSYTKDGKPHGITLYGVDAKQVVEDNCDRLANLKVQGELHASVPEDWAERWAMIDAYERKRSQP